MVRWSGDPWVYVTGFNAVIVRVAHAYNVYMVIVLQVLPVAVAGGSDPVEDQAAL